MLRQNARQEGFTSPLRDKTLDLQRHRLLLVITSCGAAGFIDRNPALRILRLGSEFSYRAYLLPPRPWLVDRQIKNSTSDQPNRLRNIKKRERVILL